MKTKTIRTVTYINAAGLIDQLEQYLSPALIKQIAEALEAKGMTIKLPGDQALTMDKLMQELTTILSANMQLTANTLDQFLEAMRGREMTNSLSEVEVAATLRDALAKTDTGQSSVVQGLTFLIEQADVLGKLLELIANLEKAGQDLGEEIGKLPDRIIYEVAEELDIEDLDIEIMLLIFDDLIRLLDREGFLKTGVHSLDDIPPSVRLLIRILAKI